MRLQYERNALVQENPQAKARKKDIVTRIQQLKDQVKKLAKDRPDDDPLKLKMKSSPPRSAAERKRASRMNQSVQANKAELESSRGRMATPEAKERTRLRVSRLRESRKDEEQSVNLHATLGQKRVKRLQLAKGKSLPTVEPLKLLKIPKEQLSGVISSRAGCRTSRAPGAERRGYHGQLLKVSPPSQDSASPEAVCGTSRASEDSASPEAVCGTSRASEDSAHPEAVCGTSRASEDSASPEAVCETSRASEDSAPPEAVCGTSLASEDSAGGSGARVSILHILIKFTIFCTLFLVEWCT